MTPALLEGGSKVIDIAADFRLRDASLYPVWYRFEHVEPAISARLSTACRSCTATPFGNAAAGQSGVLSRRSLLALLPLLKSGKAQTSGIVIDAKSRRFRRRARRRRRLWLCRGERKSPAPTASRPTTTQPRSNRSYQPRRAARCAWCLRPSRSHDARHFGHRLRAVSRGAERGGGPGAL